jgi:membrane fusion protein
MHDAHEAGVIAAEAAPKPAEALFRPQVLQERQTQWLGTVLLRPHGLHRLAALFALFAAGAILGLLVFASYARKARVPGWLVPEQGLVRVFAAQPGVLSNLFVKDGDMVYKGQPLFILSTEQHSAALGDTQSHIVRGIEKRRASLIEEERQNALLQRQQARVLKERLVALEQELAQIREEIGLQQARAALAAKSEQRQQELMARGFISAQQLQQVAEARLEQMAKLRTLERSRTTLQRDHLALQGELKDLPIRFHAQAASIERNLLSAGQELAEAEARRETIVPAPLGGMVTAIQAELGGGVKPALPLLSIVPAGMKLEAHLYAPSRAIGFLRPGQKVLLRYQAYPYQKFGHQEGVIAGISGSAISPAELPPQLAGSGSPAGANEPVYRITVRLARQQVHAYGRPQPLQPGMQLDADIVIERRRLYEWVLDPLYTFSGKWQQ